MLVCRDCGRPSTSNAACPDCGCAGKIAQSVWCKRHPDDAVPQTPAPEEDDEEIDNDSGTNRFIPKQIAGMGWSWGGFVLPGFFCIANGIAWGAFGLLPFLNVIIGVYMGFNGHGEAWRHRRFGSLREFRETMAAWDSFGLTVFWIGVAVAVIRAMFAILKIVSLIPTQH